jgi:hypothetical protein
MSDNHTVTISGKEYLEYLKLKEKNHTYFYNHQKQIEWYREKLKTEEQNKTITVRLEINKQRSSSREARDLTSSNVYVYSLDSVRQTEFLKEKIVNFINPLCFEKDKLKKQVSILEQKIKDLEFKLSENEKTIDYFENLSWFKKIFYKKRGFK